MSAIWLSRKSFEEAKRFIQGMKRPYETHETRSSMQVKNDYFHFITSETHLGRAILGHLLACKFEILKNAKERNIETPTNPKWFRVSDYFLIPEQLPGRMFVNEFDLNHAYWRVAFELGLIGEKTYQKFLKFKTKHFRLLALGMLAKREHIRFFDAAGNQVDQKTKQDETGIRIFRKIAYEVSEEMNRLSLANEEAFRFYWFDNIIFDTSVRQIETSFGYKYKEETLKILFVPKRRIVFKLGEREFSFPRQAAESLKPNLDIVPF